MPLKTRQSSRSGSLVEISSGVEWPQSAESYRANLHTSVNGREFDHPFYSDGFFGSGGILNGPKGNAIFKLCPSALYSQCQSFMPVDPTSDYDSNFITRLLAASNPSRPTVNVPAALLESIGEIPNLIRFGGLLAMYIRDNYATGINLMKDLLRRLPNGVHTINVAYHFGIAPFIADAKALTGLGKSIDSRRKEFLDLQSGDGIRRYINLGSDRWTLGGNIYAWSTYGAGVITTFTSTSVVRHWGVARWKPSGNFPIPSSDRGIAAQLTGFTPGNVGVAVWEAIPWSWFVDYFFKIQQTLEGSNTTLATPISACVMHQVKHRTKTFAISDGPFSLSEGSFQAYSHRRGTGSILPEFGAVVPILSASQLSVLGSLAVLRSR